MKKVISLSLLTFYILLNIGLTVNLHFCGGKLNNFSFFNTNKKCSTCGNKDNTSCCKDVQFQIGTDESQLKAKVANVVPFSKWFTAVLPKSCLSSFHLFFPTYLDSTKYVSHKPLGKAHLPIYIEVCSYLI